MKPGADRQSPMSVVNLGVFTLAVVLAAPAFDIARVPAVHAVDSQATAKGLLDILEFGAVGDGVTLNTAPIQAAIDACSSQRAAGVLVAGGRFVTGTLYLKSYVTLHVAPGAEILGSTNIGDYATDTHAIMYKNESHMDRCLIFARDAEHIGIEGAGVIDGRGGREHFPNPDDLAKNRPMLIRFLECSSIRMRDVTLRNPASWTTAWLYCQDIVVDGVTIQSRVNDNGDGLDFDGCERVRVSNCAFDTSDDSICLQTSQPDRACRDITISNCIFVSQWAGLRIGLLSRGDFSNIVVSDCVFRDIRDSGLKIQMCEGAEMRNMLFANLVMENVPRPVFMTFGQQRAARDAPPGVATMKALRDITFSNLLVDASTCGADSAFILVGLPGHPIENITFDNVRFRSGGGCSTEDANPQPLRDLTLAAIGEHWPEYFSFQRTVPCHGIYAGHVQGLTVRDALLQVQDADARPAIFCHDVADLELSRITIGSLPSSGPRVMLHQVRTAVLDQVRSAGTDQEITEHRDSEGVTITPRRP
ncbi:MAG: glycoside hydrolase family 28 protein [Pirellulaceae bacterium]